MSSSHDAGYYAGQAIKEMEAPGPSKKAKKGKHKWKNSAVIRPPGAGASTAA